jgi:hypothetical protein
MLIGTALADFEASTVVTAPAVVTAVVVRKARRDRLIVDSPDIVGRQLSESVEPFRLNSIGPSVT